MGTVGFPCVQIVLADVNGLAAVGAGHLIERLAGDVVIVCVVVFGILILCVGVVLVVLLLVQICFQILQLIAQVVDLVVGAGKIFVHALDDLSHFTQQCAHGLDDLALFGGIINAQTIHKTLQISCLFVQFHTNALLVILKRDCKKPGKRSSAARFTF